MALGHFFWLGETQPGECEATPPLPQVAALPNQQFCGYVFPVLCKRLGLLSALFRPLSQAAGHQSLSFVLHS